MCPIRGAVSNQVQIGVFIRFSFVLTNLCTDGQILVYTMQKEQREEEKAVQEEKKEDKRKKEKERKIKKEDEEEQGRLHDNTVAGGWAGAVLS